MFAALRKNILYDLAAVRTANDQIVGFLKLCKLFDVQITRFIKMSIIPNDVSLLL